MIAVVTGIEEGVRYVTQYVDNIHTLLYTFYISFCGSPAIKVVEVVLLL